MTAKAQSIAAAAEAEAAAGAAGKGGDKGQGKSAVGGCWESIVRALRIAARRLQRMKHRASQI